MLEKILAPDSPLLSADRRPSGRLQHIGVRFMINGSETGGAFAIVEHPIDPLSLAAPYHTHTNEDEYSIVLEGEVGFALDETVIIGHPGDTILKPRNVRHTFWNPTTLPATILEVITPAGFEHYFAEVSEVFARQGTPDASALGEIAAKFGLSMERESMGELISKYGLRP